jgi:phosphopantothenoylcysteine decarboxylase/phosphopantothenate--cysteine ligase
VEGDLACGDFGRGKMADPEVIVDAALQLLGPVRPDAPAVLVTAGGTEEAIDPVRYLSNFSSGKMGVAIAEAARDAGHPVTFLHGALTTAAPLGVERIESRSTEEMLAALRKHSKSHPILVMAAAVADYRPSRPRRQKIAAGSPDQRLDLRPNPDLLASIAPTRVGKKTVGFALETEGNRKRAREKMLRKHCDLMVLNNPLRPGSEFGGDTNEVVFLYPDGREEKLPLMSKVELAREIIRRIGDLSPRPAVRRRAK